ncbi:DNA-3-methyladenine glycosylase [Caulobacter sp.]|uniref:DNA-3-methyladenine glycosylase n=1 Tax=Caulobacter sp. TaxID=78 RepID=UPI001B1D0A8E|nr:DNA-3-methyladenine glycosylase [Caulobacter sp.]MBO9547592.1 DNA-3-methyladenine glycosylase [Caulobacter sp.]
MSTIKHARLTREELPVDTETLARFLIGKVVVRETPDGVISGRIVETEAYIIGDAASHTFKGMTPRTRPMFLERGHAYIYLNYGVSWMLNVSSEVEGVGAGVLIRALEPLEGVALMQAHRRTEKLRDLARGPGRLTQALQIGPWADGMDLCAEGPLWLARDDHEPADIGVGIRIGITKDADRPLRFYVRGNPFVSGTKALNA